MTRPLLAALTLALASVLGPLAGASVAMPPLGATDGDGGQAQGWGSTTPGWLDPVPRGRPALAGDQPRALPRRARWLPGGRRRGERSQPASARRCQARRPDLNQLGRRQTDGG